MVQGIDNSSVSPRSCHPTATRLVSVVYICSVEKCNSHSHEWRLNHYNFQTPMLRMLKQCSILGYRVDVAFWCHAAEETQETGPR
jgi:hypothetical protein